MEIFSPLKLNIKGLAEKDPPISGDVLVIEDSADNFVQKKVEVGNLPAAMPMNHAATHVTGGADKIRDATAALDGLMTIAFASKLDGIEANAKDDQTAGEIEAIISHDNLLDFIIAQHRIINDAGSSTTELLSASKILAITGALSTGVEVKASVATTTEGSGNITLSGEQTINGVTTSASRILVLEQTAAEDNGIYVTAAGAWARSTDADSDAEVKNGLTVSVNDSNSTHHTHRHILTTANPIVVGTTGLTFDEVSALEFGTGAGQITEGDDSRIPLQDENDALVGTNGVASSANKYVTNSDPRNSDSRAPTNHASDHTDGTDDIQSATAAQKGLATAAQITKLDGVATGAEVNPDVVSQGEAEAGTATTERIWTAQRVAQAIAALETGNGGDAEHLFYADQVNISVGADWAVNAGAPTENDDNNAAIPVIALEESAETGFGFLLRARTGKSTLQIDIKSRRRTSTGGAVTMRLKLYVREIPDNGAVAAWDSGTLLTAIDYPASNEFFQYDTQDLTFVSFTPDIVAGRLYQFQITRVPTDGSDNLVAAALIAELGMKFK